MIFQFISLDGLKMRHQQQQQDNIFVKKQPVIDITDEDDYSVASTASTESTCTSISSSSSSSEISIKKSVQFNTDLNEEYVNTQMHEEEVRELWYDDEDYRHFKKQTGELARVISLIGARSRSASSYEKVLARTQEICKCVVSEPTDDNNDSIMSVDERNNLKRCLQSSPARHGLERWAVRPIARQRKLRRQEIIETVLAIQQAAVVPEQEQAPAAEYVNGRGMDRAEYIRRSANRISLPSRLFAHAMATAAAEDEINVEQKHEDHFAYLI